MLDFPAAVGAGLFGSLNDAWQVPVADVGPEGEDPGKGAKYLLLPPGYEGNVPAGYIPLRFATYNAYSIFRAIPATTSASDLEKALALVKSMRVYPLAQAASSPSSRFYRYRGSTF